MSALFLGSDSRRGRKRYRTEKVDLSFGYQLIASCIVKLFSSWVSRIPTTVLKVPSGQVVDEQPVVSIDIGGAEVAHPSLPVERVVLPHDCLQAKRVGDRTNAILRSRSMSVSCWC